MVRLYGINNLEDEVLTLIHVMVVAMIIVMVMVVITSHMRGWWWCRISRPEVVSMIVVLKHFWLEGILDNWWGISR